MGGVHKINEINSFTHLHTISHKMNKEYKQTVEIIKMKMFQIVQLAPSRNSTVDTTCAMSMQSQDRSLLTNNVNCLFEKTKNCNCVNPEKN